MGTNKTVFELCPHCDTEVKLHAIKKMRQKCPSCGIPIRACSICKPNHICDCDTNGEGTLSIRRQYDKTYKTNV